MYGLEFRIRENNTGLVHVNFIRSCISDREFCYQDEIRKGFKEISHNVSRIEVSDINEKIKIMRLNCGILDRPLWTRLVFSKKIHFHISSLWHLFQNCIDHFVFTEWIHFSLILCGKKVFKSFLFKKVLKIFLPKRRKKDVQPSVEHIYLPLEVRFQNKPKSTNFERGPVRVKSG